MFNFENIWVRVFFGVIGFVFWGFVSSAEAADLKLNIGLKISEEYSSNIYLAETDELDDYTSRLLSKLDFGWSTPKSHLNMDYTISVMEYSFPQDEEMLEGDKEYVIWHNLKFNTGTYTRGFFGKRLYFDVTEEFFQNDDPHRVERGFLTGRNEYYINRLSPQIRYKLGNKLQLAVKYVQEILEYKQADIEDSREHRGILSMQHKLNSKNWLKIEYQYAKRSFDVSQSYRVNQGWLKFYHILNSYVKCDLGGGYQDRSYTEGLVEDWKGITLLAGLEATTWNKLSSRFTYQSQPNTLGYFAFYRSQRLDMHLKYELLTDLLLVSDPFIQWDDYRQPKDRRDRLIGWGGKLSYTIHEGWQAEAAYHRLERHSNVSGNSYHENNVSISLSAYYDFF